MYDEYELLDLFTMEEVLRKDLKVVVIKKRGEVTVKHTVDGRAGLR